MKLIDTKNVQFIAQFTILHFLKRALSSPYALKKSLINRINKLKTNEEESQVSLDDVQTLITENDNFENISTEDALKRVEGSSLGQQITELEIKRLTEIYHEVDRIKPKDDTKYNKLTKEIIPELFSFSDKMIIFTRYKDTLDYLTVNLKNEFDDTEILGIYGDMKPAQRKEVFLEFEEAEKAILVATDCISEGMNLQYLCSQIIHYELPWNPNRLEQRNGRVDRYGQPEDEVHIRSIIVDGSLDELILKRIIERSDRIKEAFGFSPPFFNNESDIVKYLFNVGKVPLTRSKKEKHDNSLRQLSLYDSFNNNSYFLNNNTKAADADDEYNYEEEDIFFNKQIQKIKNESFYGQTDIRLPEIEKKLEQTQKSIGREEDLEKFVLSGLRLFGCNYTQKNEKVFEIHLNNEKLRLSGREKDLPNITFDKNYAITNPDLELIDLSHPLLNRIVQLVKQQMYLESSEHYGRIAYKISNTITSPVVILKVLTRFVVNTEPTSVIEEIIPIGFYVYNSKIMSSQEIKNFEDGNPLPGQRSDEEVKEDIEEVFSNNEYWMTELEKNINDYQNQIISERKKILESFEDTSLPEWLNGATDISFASQEVLTLTIGYPV